MFAKSFAVAVGAGFDARVMSSTSQAMKSRFGVMAYFATVLRMLPSLPVVETEIVVDGRTFEMPTVAVLVANCGQIIPDRLGPRARSIRPMACWMSSPSAGGNFLTASAARSRLRAHSLFRSEPGFGGQSLRQRGSRIVVTTEPAEPIQADGDTLAVTTGSFTATGFRHR